MWDTYSRLCKACGQEVFFEVTDDCDDPDVAADFVPSHCPGCNAKLFTRNTFKPDPAEIEQFFFRAMSQGWVNDVQTEPGAYPNWNANTFDEGTPLKLIDTWFNAEGSHRSFGMTMIYYGNTLLWYMQYFGWCYPGAIPVLKAALKTAYNAHQFFGGRGFPRFAQDDYVYTNRILEGSAFCLADGDETVTHPLGSTDITFGAQSYHCEWVWEGSGK